MSEHHFLTRRRFLVASGGGILVAGLLPGLRLAAAPLAGEASYQLDFIRPSDMLQLHFDFYNLVLSTSGRPELVRQDPTASAEVVVTFTSQHLMEQTIDEGAVDLPDAGGIATKAVGTSQIAFTVPTTVTSLPLTDEGLLNWSQWVMRVVPVALPPDATAPFPSALSQAPTSSDRVTDLLLVDSLHLSPDAKSTWTHVPRPVSRNGRTELWHTRLARRDTDGRPAIGGPAPTVRAIWADPVDQTVFKTLAPPASVNVPGKIVAQTTDYSKAYVAPIPTEFLLLSAVGSSLELEGYWENPAPVAKWQHRSVLGRDNYVRIEERGYLFPFGNRATKIAVTERKFGSDGRAYLFQRRFIVIQEPVKNYPDDHGFQPNGGRQFPFQQIRLTALVTPDLPPDPEPIPGSGESFWIPNGADKKDLPFPVIAIDHAGATVEFTCSLAFVALNDAHGGPVIVDLVAAWSSYTGIKTPGSEDPRRTIAMRNQKMASVPPSQPGDTSFPTSMLYLGAERNPAPDVEKMKNASIANFFPTMLAAKVRVPAVDALTGKSSEPIIALDPVYVKTAPALRAAANVADTFARVQNSVSNMDLLMAHLIDETAAAPQGTVGAAFAGKNVGGVAVPNMDVGALSRSLGPLSGSVDAITGMQGGSFDPKDFFKGEAAKLLGDIPLAEILGDQDIGSGGPKIKTTIIYRNNDPNDVPEAALTTLDWKPKLKNQEIGPFEAFGNGQPATLELHGEFRIDFASGESSSHITGDLRNFTIHLVDRKSETLYFIALVFNRFQFEAHNDAKPKLSPELARVEFKGPLNFINTLQKFLQTAGGSGLAVDVQPFEISVGYTLALPNVSLGVFSLQNLSFSAGLTLPLTGEPVRARFAFCSREQKFLVGVYVFAGGGFLALELGPDGLVKLEAAIEFGGNLSLDIVVASGSVTVMAGIYFMLEVKDGKENITLTGYVRATGRLSVLGIITITAEFYLGLTYRSEGNVVEGEASLTISIDILFFSTSVTLRVKKSFAGPAPAAALRAGVATTQQPGFTDLMTQSDWNTYCDSFAA